MHTRILERNNIIYYNILSLRRTSQSFSISTSTKKNKDPIDEPLRETTKDDEDELLIKDGVDIDFDEHR